MKYYDFVKDLCKGSIDVDITDKTMDMLVNFSFDIEDMEKYIEDENYAYWTVMDYLARQFTVDSINFNARIIVLDIYGFCERNFESLIKLFDQYFYGYSKDENILNGLEKEELIEKMTIQFEHIIAGSVSNSFYKSFVNMFIIPQIKAKIKELEDM